MNTTNDYLPRLPDIREPRGGPRDLLQRRGALLDASERIVEDCEKSGRSATSDEMARLDNNTAHIAGINTRLAAYKSERIANNDSGLPLIFPF
jgi:hypothetical protein